MLKYLWLMVLIAVIVYQRQNTFGKKFIPVVFMLMAFAVIRGTTMLINSSYPERSLMIEGRILKKYHEQLSRRSGAYYVEVLDTLDNMKYKFRVSAEAFMGIDNTSTYFSKEFQLGAFGVIFRKEL